MTGRGRVLFRALRNDRRTAEPDARAGVFEALEEFGREGGFERRDAFARDADAVALQPGGWVGVALEDVEGDGGAAQALGEEEAAEAGADDEDGEGFGCVGRHCLCVEMLYN